MAGPATSDWRQLFRPTVSNRVLWLLCLMYLLLYVDRVNISTAAPLIKKELGFDNATLGLVFAAFAYPYAALQLIGGWLGALLGSRPPPRLFAWLPCPPPAATCAARRATLRAARRPARPRRGRRRLGEWPALARRILPVTAVDFCYGWTLWLFLSWIPSFFYESFHLPLKDSALFSSGVFLAGVVGDTLGGLISDRILQRTGDVRRARCSVIAAGLFGAFLVLIPVVFVHDLP